MKKGNKKSINKATKKTNKNFIGHVLIILALVCLIVVAFISYNTYSLWLDTFVQTETNKVSTGCFELSVSDLDENDISTAINLNNAYPLTNERGLETTPYKIKITNVCNVPSEYTILLSTLSSTTLDAGFLRYQIQPNNNIVNDTQLLNTAPTYELDESIKTDIETLNSLTVSNSYNLANGSLNEGETIDYELRIWLDYDATNDAMNKKFEGTVTVLSTSPH